MRSHERFRGKGTNRTAAFCLFGVGLKGAAAAVVALFVRSLRKTVFYRRARLASLAFKYISCLFFDEVPQRGVPKTGILFFECGVVSLELV